jgi:hypothetical protein
MVEIVFDPDFAGPDIVALAPTLPPTDEVIHISWKNTKQEVLVLTGLLHRNFVLHVDEHVDRQHAAWSLGLPLEIDATLLEQAKLFIGHQKGYDWRKFAETQGDFKTKNLILKLAANQVRSSKARHPLIATVENVVLDGVSPADADLMLRLNFLETRNGRP